MQLPVEAENERIGIIVGGKCLHNDRIQPEPNLQ